MVRGVCKESRHVCVLLCCADFVYVQSATHIHTQTHANTSPVCAHPHARAIVHACQTTPTIAHLVKVSDRARLIALEAEFVVSTVAKDTKNAHVVAHAQVGPRLVMLHACMNKACFVRARVPGHVFVCSRVCVCVCVCVCVRVCMSVCV